jgi:hypothetical protein
MRHVIAILSAIVTTGSELAMAEPPNIENADHLTGCIANGRLHNFEISGWGAYRPCGKAEWVTLQRANQNSRTFTVEAMEAYGSGLTSEGFAGGIALTLVTTVGGFFVYSSSQYCAIAVGPARLEAPIIYAGRPDEEVWQPYMIDLAFADVAHFRGVTRQGRPEEVFFDPLSDGIMSAEVLSVMNVYAVNGPNGYCRAAVTFEYAETPSAHTVYHHDREVDQITVEYRKEN